MTNTLKAKMNEHITIGHAKAAREYLKDMVYSKWDIETAAHKIAKEHGIATAGTIEIDLTLYEKYGEFETVVHITGKGSEPETSGFGFYEIYFIYEKGADDSSAIVNYYSQKYTNRPEANR